MRAESDVARFATSSRAPRFSTRWVEFQFTDEHGRAIARAQPAGTTPIPPARRVESRRGIVQVHKKILAVGSTLAELCLLAAPPHVFILRFA